MATLLTLAFTSPTLGADWLEQLENKNRILDQQKQERDQQTKQKIKANLEKIVATCERLKTSYKFNRTAVAQLSRSLRSDPSTIKVQGFELRRELLGISCVGIFTYPRGTAFCNIRTSKVTNGNVIGSIGECW